MMRELPTDLLIKIFLLLPVESLVRYKFVCKTWLKLILSPTFVSMHLDFTKTSNPSILVNRTGHEKNFCEFSFHGKEKSLRKLSLNLEIPNGSNILGTRNGVILIKDRWGLFLYNPATKVKRQLPFTEKPTRWVDNSPASCQKEVVGFGHASSNILDLKVVIIYELSSLGYCTRDLDSWWCGPTKGVVANLISLSSNKCTRLDWCLESVQIYPGNPFDTFLEYSCHWYAERCNSRGQTEEWFILCFNMNTDSFRTMGIAKDCLESLAQSQKRFPLGVLKESLSLITYTERVYVMLDVWVMKEYGVAESWTKLFEVKPFLGLGDPYPLWMYDEALILEQGGELIMRNLETHGTKPITRVIGGSNPYLLRPIMQVWSYKESLLSIKGECNEDFCR